MYLSVKKLKKLTFRSVILLMSLLSFSVFADPTSRWQLNMEPGVTDIGQKIYDLHMTVTWICVIISCLVFGWMAYIIVMHRKSSGRTPATFHEHLGVELAWTIIPFFILGAIAIPSTKVLVEIYDTSESDIDILITGYRWKWKYEYINNDGGENFSFMSNLSTPRAQIDGKTPEAIAAREANNNYLLEVDEPVVIPVGKKTRFLVTAADVIHSWWVPALAVKKDATPGYINETWTIPNEIGTYRGQCAELCGKDHGFMPIVVKVVSEEDFIAWKEEKSAAVDMSEKTHDELMSVGKGLYETNCAGCHGVTGEGIPGAFPALKGSAIATGDMNKHIDVVVNGVAGTSMAAYGVQLDALKMAAIITYERNAWGNNTGDTIQATDVANFQNSQ